MQIIGQFNLGFIVTKIDRDLFIIDQHASDEKFRFEKLNNETKLKTQLLIAPKLLNLSSLNETILIDNQTIFDDNGFSFAINSEGKCIFIFTLYLRNNHLDSTHLKVFFLFFISLLIFFFIKKYSQDDCDFCLFDRFK